MQVTTAFLGNLPKEVTEEFLQKHFEPFGPVSPALVYSLLLCPELSDPYGFQLLSGSLIALRNFAFAVSSLIRCLFFSPFDDRAPNGQHLLMRT